MYAPEKLLSIKPVGCDSCIGLCCRAGITMELNADEAAFMEASGTKLTRRADGDFTLETDCANLAEDETARTYCAAYDNPERPRACADFEPGGPACRSLRAKEEIDSGGEYAAFLAATGQLAFTQAAATI